MAKLPEALEELEEKTIYRMLPGDTGYTLPWAVWADADRELWINGDYSYDDEALGTSHLRIRRTESGVEVDFSTVGDYQYRVGASSWDSLEHKLPVIPKF